MIVPPVGRESLAKRFCWLWSSSVLPAHLWRGWIAAGRGGVSHTAPDWLAPPTKQRPCLINNPKQTRSNDKRVAPRGSLARGRHCTTDTWSLAFNSSISRSGRGVFSDSAIKCGFNSQSGSLDGIVTRQRKSRERHRVCVCVRVCVWVCVREGKLRFQPSPLPRLPHRWQLLRKKHSCLWGRLPVSVSLLFLYFWALEPIYLLTHHSGCHSQTTGIAYQIKLNNTSTVRPKCRRWCGFFFSRLTKNNEITEMYSAVQVNSPMRCLGLSGIK